MAAKRPQAISNLSRGFYVGVERGSLQRALGYREIASDADLENANAIAAHRALGFEEKSVGCTFEGQWIASSATRSPTIVQQGKERSYADLRR